MIHSLLLAILFGVPVVLGKTVAPPIRALPVPPRELPAVPELGEAGPVSVSQTIREIAREVSQRYADAIPVEELYLDSIEAIFSRLDAHSRYMSRERLMEHALRQMNGSLVGLGASFRKEGPNEPMIVLFPYMGSPALAAGLQPGDEIIAIGSDGGEPESVVGVGLTEAISRLKGEAGQPVSLKVLRRDADGGERVLEMRINRARFKTEQFFSTLLPNGVGYVHFNAFVDERTRNTRNKFGRALAELSGQGMRALILDLRFNPGGSVNAAIGVSSLLLDHGDPILIFRRRGEDWPIHSDLRGRTDFPIIVLVNSGTASASEIVAGALQDNGRARIMGTPTYGKGSSQSLIFLEDGSGMFLTTDWWLTPNGRSIDRDRGGSGIVPDLPLKSDTVENMKTLHPFLRAIETRKQDPNVALPEPDPMIQRALEELAPQS